MNCTTPQPVRLSDLNRDERLRLRVDYHTDLDNQESAVVSRYADAMAEEYDGTWGEFPPLNVVRLTEEHIESELSQPMGQKRRYAVGSLLLVGGFTRVAAAAKLGITEAPAFIVNASWQDAERMAWKENTRHGRPRTQAERYLVYRRIIAANPGSELSCRALAKLAGTSKTDANHFLKAERETRERWDKIDNGFTAPIDSDNPGEAMKCRTPSSRTGKVFTSIRCDMWGTPMPDCLRGRFHDVPDILKQTRLVTDAIVRLCERKHGKDGQEKCDSEALRHIDINDIYATIDTQISLITGGIPWIVCPSCEGLECETCNHKGYLTRLEADDLPPNLEKKARRYMTDREKHQ